MYDSLVRFWSTIHQSGWNDYEKGKEFAFGVQILFNIHLSTFFVQPELHLKSNQFIWRHIETDNQIVSFILLILYYKVDPSEAQF